MNRADGRWTMIGHWTMIGRHTEIPAGTVRAIERQTGVKLRH